MQNTNWNFSRRTRRVIAPRAGISPLNALNNYVELSKVVANKWELDDIDAEAVVAAEEYTRQYVGSFDYMLSMKDALARFHGLTEGQAKGVLNCLRAEVQRNERRAATPPAGKPQDVYGLNPIGQEDYANDGAFEPAPLNNLPNAIFTVVIADGSHVTLKIKAGTERFGAGKQVVSFLSGSDNESDYTGFAFLTGRTVSVWSRFRNNDNSRIIEAINFLVNPETDALAAGKRYALESGKCCVCNRTLTVPESIENGIGPECAKNFGS